MLQEGEVVRLGGSAARRVDVRVIAATNRPLPGEVAAGRFRRDLLYRLDVLSIALPPLRQRVEDIPALAEAFLGDAEAEVGRAGLRLSDEAMAVLQAWTWPGNVRQLRNVILRAAATAPGLEIRAADLPADLQGATADGRPAPRSKDLPVEARTPAAAGPDPAAPSHDSKREALAEHLHRRAWNMAQVAKDLGVSRMTLYRRLERLGLARPVR